MENQEASDAQMIVDDPQLPGPSNEIQNIKHDDLVLKKTSALALLAQYSGSESEEEDDAVADTIYRKPVSESSSSCSSSDEELDIKVIEKKIREPVQSDGDSDDDNTNKKKKREPLKVKGEMTIDELPPIADLQITVDERECTEIGVITTVVDQLVLVEALRNSVPLDIDSVLFLDNGKQVLGQIFDVIGPVAVPIYCVRFNKHDDIAAKGISVGDKVFFAPRTEYSNFVILSQVMKPGSDASWKNDIEPPDNLVDYSDDEQERRIKKQAKANRMNNQNPNPNAIPNAMPNQGRNEFVRGRRQFPNQTQYQQQNQGLAYPNYSWHQNLPSYSVNSMYPPPQ